MRVRITDQFVKQAEPHNRAAPIFMDADLIGFGVQVRPSGRKTFTLDYSFERRRRRIFIGDYPEWPVTAAREEAKRLKREIDRGVDPLAIREERFDALTVAELVQRYLSDHVVRLPAEAMNVHGWLAFEQGKDVFTRDAQEAADPLAVRRLKLCKRGR